MNCSRKLTVRRRSSFFHIAFVLPVMIAALGSVLGFQVTAQTFSNLHKFTSSEGVAPNGVIVSGTVLYGTAVLGGRAGNGTVFRVNTDGSDFRVLHDFSGAPTGTNADGMYPTSLLLVGNYLYGSADAGGNSGGGTLFALNADGTDFKILHNFNSETDGAEPTLHSLASGHILYGTTESAEGTLFAVNTDGTGFKTLHSFVGDNTAGYLAGSSFPASSNTLYGITFESVSWGSIFRISTDGTGFTNVYDFTQASDGAYPQSRLYLSGNYLYGSAAPRRFVRTVFKVRIDGTDFATICTNITETGDFGLIGLSANTPYVLDAFVRILSAINTDGSGLTSLYAFTDSDISSAEFPSVSAFTRDVVYGTTAHPSGMNALDRIFSISMSPQLRITRGVENVVVAWPTNYAGFDYSGYHLQSTTNLTSPIWTTYLAPVMVNGQNTVTNPISGTQQFFRVSQ
jgi:uncharacterized repeat protein (TIGR03803 family)